MQVTIGSMLLSSLIIFALDAEWSYIIASFFIVFIMSTIAVWELEHR
jgi:hypothetical protein